MYCKINDINLYYELYNAQCDKVIIFLHGNGENLHIFDKPIEFFNNKYKIIAIDSRGHGKSEFGNAQLSIPLISNDIIEFINSLHNNETIAQLTLVGFSDGGNIALEVASAIPNLIDNLIVVGANLFPSGMKLYVLIEIYIQFFLYSMLSFASKYNLKKKYYKIMTKQPEISKEKLNNITARTLIIAGENDVIKDTHTKLIQASINASKIIIIKNGNHFLFEKNNLEINTIISNFIS